MNMDIDAIDFKNGDASATLYWYLDDPSVGYLADLKTTVSSRGQGLASKLIETIKDKARQMNMEFLYLRVLNGTWMKNWYERIGFSPILIDGDYSWMKFSL